MGSVSCPVSGSGLHRAQHILGPCTHRGVEAMLLLGQGGCDREALQWWFSHLSVLVWGLGSSVRPWAGGSTGAGCPFPQPPHIPAPSSA